jgi:hypothetical protein
VAVGAGVTIGVGSALGVGEGSGLGDGLGEGLGDGVEVGISPGVQVSVGASGASKAGDGERRTASSLPRYLSIQARLASCQVG